VAKKQPALTVPVGYTRYKLKPHKKMGPLGLTKFHKKTIYVNKQLKEVGAWSATFWYEWLHAVAHQGGYYRVSDNEAYIEYMAQAIMRMLTDETGREIVLRMVNDLK
jgi:hypothetical protein